MREVAAGAGACGRAIEDDFIQYMLGLTVKMEPYLTSMKLDFDRKHPIEVEAIFGNPIRAAAAGGVQCPRIESLYRQLKFLDQRNRD